VERRTPLRRRDRRLRRAVCSSAPGRARHKLRRRRRRRARRALARRNDDAHRIARRDRTHGVRGAGRAAAASRCGRCG